jgi:hypothetical protein
MFRNLELSTANRNIATDDGADQVPLQNLGDHAKVNIQGPPRLYFLPSFHCITKVNLHHLVSASSAHRRPAVFAVDVACGQPLGETASVGPTLYGVYDRSQTHWP